MSGFFEAGATVHTEALFTWWVSDSDDLGEASRHGSRISVRPILDRLRSDGVTRQYLGGSKTWATVTPVIFPGHDDHKAEKTIKLIERALAQSGIEQGCQFTWSALAQLQQLPDRASA